GSARRESLSNSRVNSLEREAMLMMEDTVVSTTFIAPALKLPMVDLHISCAYTERSEGNEFHRGITNRPNTNPTNIQSFLLTSLMGAESRSTT
ncbi:hypothetical protein PMAYCL1PPCAC_27439, partial [Pristionchus mayeri]